MAEDKVKSRRTKKDFGAFNDADEKGAKAPPELVAASPLELGSNPLKAATGIAVPAVAIVAAAEAQAPIIVRRKPAALAPLPEEGPDENKPAVAAVAPLPEEGAGPPKIRRVLAKPKALTYQELLQQQKEKEDSESPLYAKHRLQAEKAWSTKDNYLIDTPPPAFVPPTRRGFIKFFDDTFAAEGVQAANFTLTPKMLGEFDPDACSKMGSTDKIEVFKYQEFVREYLRTETPYRGLLVYHGLGSGKTCSAIAAAEALFGATQRKIIVLTPGSLRVNFQQQVAFCGFRHFQTANHWTFMPLTPTMINFAITVLNVSEQYIDRLLGGRADLKKGIYVPDFDAEPNFDSLDATDRAQIQVQIQSMIEGHMQFYNYNGVRASELKRLVCEAGANPDRPGPFDNAVIIIDEIHNLSRLMQGKLHGYMEQSGGKRLVEPEPVMPDRWQPRLCNMSRNYKRGFLLYRLIAEAKNSKIIGLSGTPLINFPDELAPLINMVMGYTHAGRIFMSGGDTAKFKEIADKHLRVDYVSFKTDKGVTEILFTTFLSGFVKVLDGTGTFLGIKEDGGPEGLKGPAVVAKELITAGKAAGLTFRGEEAAKTESFPVLPVNPDAFDADFVDVSTFAPKNVAVLKKRLYGGISYYKGASEDLMPRIVSDEEVRVNFGEYATQYYTKKRIQELESSPAEMKAAGGENPYEDAKKAGSTANYRFNSRAACNFCFPAEIPRPFRSAFRIGEDVAAAAEIDEEADGIITEEVFEQTAADDSAIAEAISEEKAILAEEGDAQIEEAPVDPAVRAFHERAEKEAADAGFTLREDAAAAKPAYHVQSYAARLTSAIAAIKAGSDRYLKLDGPAGANLETYSPKFAAMIRNINNEELIPGTSLIYSQFYSAEGLKLFGIALEANGYSHIELAEVAGEVVFKDENVIKSIRSRGAKRYIFFSGEQTPTVRRVVLNLFNGRIRALPPKMAQILLEAGYDNDLANKNGAICKVIGITGAGAEGISLKFVRAVHIMEPYWNDVRLEQVKGRAVRICSHAELPPEQRTVRMFTYVASFTKDEDIIMTLKTYDKSRTSDQHVLEISKNKKKLNEAFIRILKEVSVDCKLNAGQNLSEEDIASGFACYGGTEGSITEQAVAPDLKTDIDITQVEQRMGAGAGPAVQRQATVQRTVIVKAAAEPDKGAVAVAAATAGQQVEKRMVSVIPVGGKAVKVVIQPDVESGNPDFYIAYDFTNPRTIVAKLKQNPNTSKFSIRKE